MAQAVNTLLKNKVQKVDTSTQKGRQELAKFIAKNDKYQNVELIDVDEKLFNKIMKKYSIAYAFDKDDEKNLIVAKLGASPEKVADAIKEYTNTYEKELERKERKEQMKENRRQKKQERKEAEKENKEKEYNKENPYARGNY